MARKQQRYPPKFRREIVGLVCSGRSPESLAKEFEPSALAIRKWVKQADLDEGHRSDGLTTFERQELRQAKREIKRLRMERDILKKPRLGSPGRAARSRKRIRVREGSPGPVSDPGDVPCSLVSPPVGTTPG